MLIFRKFMFRGFLLAISFAVSLLAGCADGSDSVFGGDSSLPDDNCQTQKIPNMYLGMSVQTFESQLACKPEYSRQYASLERTYGLNGGWLDLYQKPWAQCNFGGTGGAEGLRSCHYRIRGGDVIWLDFTK